MALQQTHISFLKEIMEYNPEYFKDINTKSLFYGSVYPDLFYVNFLHGKSNFSLYLHSYKSIKDIFALGKKLLDNSKTTLEKSFSLGFISHFFLDKRIHTYLEKIGFAKGAEHLVLEFYLHTKVLKTDKIIVSKVPKRLLKKVFNKYLFSDTKLRYNFIPSYFRQKLFLFVCNYIIRETIAIRYLKIKKSNFFKNLFLRVSFYPAFRSYNYKIDSLFYPKDDFLTKHIPFLLKEYNLAKEDYIEFLKLM